MKTTEIVHDAVVLSENKELQTNLEKENITDKVILNLKTEYSGLKIVDVKDVAGYNAVDEARKNVKRIRVMAEKIVKTQTDKAYQAHKLAVADGKKVIARFTEIESELEAKQLVIDTEKKRIADELAEAERQRIQGRVDQLKAVGYSVDFNVLSMLSDDEFNETLADATALHEQDIAKKAEEKFLADWDEAIVENQRLNNEAESKRLQKIADDQVAAQKKIDDAAALLKKQIRDNRASELRPYAVFIRDYNALIEKEESEYQSEFADIKKGAEIQWEADRKAIADKAIKDANDKAEADKKELARIEALKPIKERFSAWVESFSIEIHGELTDHPTVKEVFKKHAAFKQWAREQVNTIQ